jgi:hypothetical protein
MKKMMSLAAILAAVICFAPAAGAETTVSVDDGSRVSVNRNAGSTTIVTPAPAVAETRVVTVPSDKDVDLSGRIVSVDAPHHEIVVRDELPHDRRIIGDPGIVSTLKVGDYVNVRLRHGSDTEAFRIIERN